MDPASLGYSANPIAAKPISSIAKHVQDLARLRPNCVMRFSSSCHLTEIPRCTILPPLTIFSVRASLGG